MKTKEQVLWWFRNHLVKESGSISYILGYCHGRGIDLRKEKIVTVNESDKDSYGLLYVNRTVDDFVGWFNSEEMPVRECHQMPGCPLIQRLGNALKGAGTIKQSNV